MSHEESAQQFRKPQSCGSDSRGRLSAILERIRERTRARAGARQGQTDSALKSVDARARVMIVRRLRLWLSGIAVGTVSVPMWIYAAAMTISVLWLSLALVAVVLGLVAVVVLLRPWPAGAAGVLVGVGGWFLFLLMDGANRCAANPSCELGDNTAQNAIVACFIVTGLVLTAYAVWSERTAGLRSHAT
jgi:hypothetical protein